MSRSCGRLVMLLACVAACHGAQPGQVQPETRRLPKARAACYALDYHERELASRLPSMIALDASGERARWLPSPRGDTTSRGFEAGGRWERQGRGHVIVNFDAEDVHVTLDLEQREGMVTGHAVRRAQGSDGAATEHSTTVEGKHVSCPRPATDSTAN